MQSSSELEYSQQFQEDCVQSSWEQQAAELLRGLREGAQLHSRKLRRTERGGRCRHMAKMRRTWRCHRTELFQPPPAVTRMLLSEVFAFLCTLTKEERRAKFIEDWQEADGLKEKATVFTSCAASALGCAGLEAVSPLVIIAVAGHVEAMLQATAGGATFCQNLAEAQAPALGCAVLVKFVLKSIFYCSETQAASERFWRLRNLLASGVPAAAGCLVQAVCWKSVSRAPWQPSLPSRRRR